MRRALARFVDLETARGLEIGPLDRPVLDKSRHRVEYLDLDTADAARTRLEKDPQRSPETVVEVDYPLKGETMSAVVPNQAFDYIFASHVFEHFPDVIGWLQDAAKVLRPGGRVLLFVPDRRFMFDLARPCTTLGQLIENHLVGKKKPSIGAIIDHHYYKMDVTPAQLWKQPAPDRRKALTRTEVDNLIDISSRRYVDTHCSVFTAISFHETMSLLHELEFQPFLIEALSGPEIGMNDFFASLVLRG